MTLEDSENRRRYLNSRRTLGTLIDLGAVPIVNENDTVATDEIRYGDNDRLAAQVASMAGADVLVLLSDVDGLYTANPRARPYGAAARRRHGDHAGDRGDGRRRRLGAVARRHEDQDHRRPHRDARRAAPWRSAKGAVDRPLTALEAGAPCTWFEPDGDPHAARKRWISGMKPRGRVTVDAGAVAALGRGKSLLPAGVTAVEGGFLRGDPIEVARARRRGGRAGAGGLRCRRGAGDHGAPVGPDRRSSSAIRGGRRWCTATTWRCEGRVRWT